MSEGVLKITSIEEQVKDPERRSIFVNGHFALGVSRDVLLGLGLEVGQVITEQQLSEVAQAENIRQAKASAYNLLSYRARSERELRQRLHRKGYSDDVIDRVIAGLVDLDILNDANFSREWVESRLRSKPMGKNLMAWELRQKGIDPSTVAEATGGIDSDTEKEMAFNLARTKIERMHEPDVFSKRRKMTSLLRRRGFSWDTISSILDELLPTEDSVE